MVSVESGVSVLPEVCQECQTFYVVLILSIGLVLSVVSTLFAASVVSEKSL
jgi:hypothetical protein